MSWISKAGKAIEHGIASVIPHQTARAVRDQRKAQKEQIDLYKRQKDEFEKATADTKREKEEQQRLINEKQIRAMRHHYRRSTGFLNTSDSPEAEIKSTLG